MELGENAALFVNAVSGAFLKTKNPIEMSIGFFIKSMYDFILLENQNMYLEMAHLSK